MEGLLAESGPLWGLIVIIAYLLGMGTPYPWRKEDRRNGTEERRADRKEVLFRILALLEELALHLPHPRPAEPDEHENKAGKDVERTT